MSVSAFCCRRILLKILKRQTLKQPFSSTLRTFPALNWARCLFPSITTHRMYSSLEIDEKNDVSLLSNETMDSMTLIKKIVKHHKENKLTFILPWSDSEAMNLIKSPFDKLLKEGFFFFD